MKVLGIAGSPRRHGNTDILLQQLMDGARSAGADVEIIRVADLKIAPCLHCDGCLAEGKCVVDDDMQQLYPKLRAADRLVLASPMFFMGLTAQIKAMIDRCQALWALKYALKLPLATNTGGERRGAFVSVGGTGFSHLFDSAMPTIKSLFAVIDVKYAGEITYAKIDEKGAIRNHPTALNDAFEMGKNLAD